MVSGSIEIDVSKMVAELEGKKQAILEANEGAAEDIGDRGIEILQENTPVLTGLLQSSWIKAVEASGTVSKVSFINPIEYGVFVNYGTSRQVGQFFLEISMSELESEAEAIWNEKMSAALSE